MGFSKDLSKSFGSDSKDPEQKTKRPAKKRKMSADSYALYLLGRQDYTEHALRSSMHRKGYEPADIDRIVKTLLETGLLSDRRYAESYVYSNKLRYGPHRVARFLKEKGVSKEIIEEALEGLTEEGQKDSIEEYIDLNLNLELSRRVDVSDKKAVYKLKNKMFGALCRRGFDFELIREILDRKFRNLESEFE